MLYGDVPHDEKSLSAVYGLPMAKVKAILELLVKFGLLERSSDHYAINNYAELISADKRKRHRQSQRKYAAGRMEATPQVQSQTLNRQV